LAPNERLVPLNLHEMFTGVNYRR